MILLLCLNLLVLIFLNYLQLHLEKIDLNLVESFLLKNLNNLFYDPTKIICCSAIILSGIIFKENNLNYKIGIKEL